MNILLSMLMNWLTNPQVLAGLGIAGGVLFIFLKGRSSGESSVQQEIAAAAEALNTAVHQTENTNQQVENKKNENLQNIDSINDPAELQRLLNSLTDTSSSDKPSKK